MNNASYLDIRSLVLRDEKIPQRASALARARQRLVDTYRGMRLSPIARCRLERGMSQQMLADHLDLDIQLIEELERGTGVPTLEEAERIEAWITQQTTMKC